MESPLIIECKTEEVEVKIDDVSPNGRKTLNMEESACLKKILIKHILEEELTTFGRKPEVENLDDNTVLLKHLYHRLLLEFPPFKKRGDFTLAKMKLLLVIFGSCVSELII